MKSADQCLEEALSLERAAILSESAGERLKLLRAAERLLLQALETFHLRRENQRMADQLREAHTTLERKVQERTRDLEAANAAKTRFLAAAGHDLRQPVHAIVLLVEALRARNQSESLAPLVEQLASGAATIDLLFRSLLDLSKLESRKTSPTLEPVAMSTPP